jgi:hypothetical protein
VESGRWKVIKLLGALNAPFLLPGLFLAEGWNLAIHLQNGKKLTDSSLDPIDPQVTRQMG